MASAAPRSPRIRFGKFWVAFVLALVGFTIYGLANEGLAPLGLGALQFVAASAFAAVAVGFMWAMHPWRDRWIYPPDEP